MMHRIGLKTILLMVLLALFGIFVPFPNFGYQYLSKLGFDLLHFPAFAAFAFLIASYYGVLGVGRIALVFSLPLLVEILQPITGRNGNLMDAFNGVAGLAAGFVLHRGLRRGEMAFVSAAIAMTAICEVPLVTELVTEIQTVNMQHQRVPVIFERGSILDEKLASDIQESDWVGTMLRLNGLDLKSFKRIHLEFLPVAESSHVFVRIDDDGDCGDFESRYNGAFDISAGQSGISISLADIEHAPHGRLLNLTALSRLLFFGEKKSVPLPALTKIYVE